MPDNRATITLDLLTNNAENRLRNFALSVAGLAAGVLTLRTAFDSANRILRYSIDIIDDYNVSLASSAATLTTLMESNNEADLASNFESALNYSKQLVPVLEDIASKTLLSGRQVREVNEGFVRGGQVLDTNNQKQVEGIKNISNALAVLLKGQMRQGQILQETQDLWQGQVTINSTLAKFLEAKLRPQLEAAGLTIGEQLRMWAEQNILIEKVGENLAGFKVAQDLISDSWEATKTTLQTIVDQILRGAMLPVYEDIINSAKDLNTYLVENKKKLTEISLIYSGIKEKIKEANEESKKNTFDFQVTSAADALDFFTKDFIKIANYFKEQAPEADKFKVALLNMSGEEVKASIKDMETELDILNETMRNVKDTDMLIGISEDASVLAEKLELAKEKLKEFDNQGVPNTKKDIEDTAGAVEKLTKEELADLKATLEQDLDLSSFDDTETAIKKVTDTVVSLSDKYRNQPETVKWAQDQIDSILDKGKNKELARIEDVKRARINAVKDAIEANKELDSEIKKQTLNSYEYEKYQIEERTKAYKKLGADSKKIKEWETNAIRELDKKRAEATKSANEDIKDSYTDTADHAVEQNKRIADETISAAERAHRTVKNLASAFSFEGLDRMTAYVKTKQNELSRQGRFQGMINDPVDLAIKANQAEAEAIHLFLKQFDETEREREIAQQRLNELARYKYGKGAGYYAPIDTSISGGPANVSGGEGNSGGARPKGGTSQGGLNISNTYNISTKDNPEMTAVQIAQQQQRQVKMQMAKMG